MEKRPIFTSKDDRFFYAKRQLLKIETIVLEDFAVRKSDTMIYCLATLSARHVYGNTHANDAQIQYWKDFEKRVIYALKEKKKKICAQDILQEYVVVNPSFHVALFEMNSNYDISFVKDFPGNKYDGLPDSMISILYDREESRYKILHPEKGAFR